tara:strand:- start:205 stop:822 length:618 start_codon:yes stop_codon:yes gene_type:complete
MRNIFFILLLFTYFQNFAKAEETNFEIEGISVGESLLKYFSKNDILSEIKSEFIYVYPKSNYIKLGIGSGEEFFLKKKIENYDQISVTIDKKDNNYIIHSVSGNIYCERSIDVCLSKQKTIVSDLNDVYGDSISLNKWKQPHLVDKSNKSIVHGIDIKFLNSDDQIAVNVYDWSTEFNKVKNWNDRLGLSIHSKKFQKYLMNWPD